MVHRFNRAEVLRTGDIVQQVRARDLLSAAGIDYVVKCPAGRPARGRKAGIFRQPTGPDCQFFVRRRDLRRALHILSQLKG